MLGWVAFWSGMSQEMLYPLIPTFVVVFLGGSKAVLGLIEGLLAAGVTVAQLGSARLLDRGASPRRLTRVSYALSLVARPLIALVPNVAMLGVLRVTDGIGKGGKDGPRDTLVAEDAGSAAGKSFGIQRALDTFGSVAGPVAAGLLVLALGNGESALRITFALAAIPAFGAAIGLTRVHDARPRPSTRPRTHGRLPRPFVVLLVAVTVFGLANSSDTLLLLRGHTIGLSSAQLAFAFAGLNLAYAAMAIPAGSLSDRIGRRPLLIVAWAVYVAVYAGFAYLERGWQLWGLFILYGLYYAAADGTLKAWVLELVPAERRGAAYGFLAAASGVLVLPASLLAGWLWDAYGPKPAFLLGAAFASVALVIVLASPSLRRELA